MVFKELLKAFTTRKQYTVFKVKVRNFEDVQTLLNLVSTLIRNNLAVYFSFDGAVFTISVLRNPNVMSYIEAYLRKSGLRFNFW